MPINATFERSVRDAVERVLEGGRLEDSQFEAKARVDVSNDQFVDRLSERLGGHANAAGGQPIVWILGLDEDAHAITRDISIDQADLVQRLQRRFDEGEAPRAVEGHWFTFEQRGAVLAIQFDTSHPPYIVRRRNGGNWTYVVPWREGTRVRAARRSELQRVLLRAVQTPSVRPLSISLKIGKNDYTDLKGRLLFNLPAESYPVFLPYEDISVSIATPTHRSFLKPEWGEMEFTPGDRVVRMTGWHRTKAPERAYATQSGLVVEWAGSIPFGASGKELLAPMALGPFKRSRVITFSFEARVLQSESMAEVTVPLRVASRDDPWEWTVDGTTIQRSLDLK